MTNVLAKIVLALAFAIGTSASLLTCSKKAPALNVTNDQAQLTESFATLYLGTYGLNYPSSEEVLQSCRSTNDTSCLRVYERVKSAARELIVMKSNATLSATFDTIRDSCGSEDEKAANFICHGALMSFYFYSEIEFDSKILEFIETLPPSTQSEIINTSFAWFHNRSDPNRWIEYLKLAPIQWQPEDSKEYTKTLFSTDVAPPLWAKE